MQGTAQSPDQDTASDGLEAERAHFRAFLPKLEFPSESLFLDDYMKLLRFAFEAMTQSERDRIQKQLKRHVKAVSVKGRWWLRDEVTRMLARHAFASDVSSWMSIVFSSFTTDDPLVAPLKTDAGLCAALGRAETAAAEIVLPPFVGEVFTRRRLAAKPPKGRELADLLVSRLREVRRYDRNMVLNLYLSVVQNFLTVFAGEPGAGKTSVCRLIAGSLGLTPERMPADLAQTGSRFVEVPVEYGWTTKRDLIGYWNPLSNRFESPDPDRWSLIRTLDAEARSAFGSCWPAVMLLDEANLSPMEYYWSDWMRLCDETEKALDGPVAVSLWDKGKTLVPPTLRFVATINNDSTTEPLSPRLIDRAAVITLPQLVELDAKRSAPAGRPENAMVAWEDLTEVFGARALGREAGDVRALLEEVDRHAQTLGIRLSPRSRRQVEGYVGAAAALFDAAQKPAWVDAVDFAVMQKVLPRISGTGGRYREGLDALLALLAKRGLERSAERLRSVVASGEDAMDCYRFF